MSKRRARAGTPKKPPASTVDLSNRLPLVIFVLSGWSAFVALPLATGTNTGRVVAVLVCAALWLFAWLMGRLPQPTRATRTLRIALAVLAVGVLLSAAFSPYAARALTWGSAGFFGAPLWLALIVVFAGVMRAPLGARNSAWVAAAFAWVLPSLAIAAWNATSGQPITGGFNTGNHFGAAMVGVLPLAIWMWRVAAVRTLRMLGGLAAFGCVVAVMASGSAAAILGLFAAGLVLVIAAPALLVGTEAARIRLLRWGTGALSVAAAAFLALPFLISSGLPVWWSGFVREQVFGTTLLTRIEMWKAGWTVFANRPLLGVGPDTFHLAAQQYLSPRLFALEPISGILSAPPDPHSLPVLLLASFGVLGMAAFLSTAFAWMQAVRRNNGAEGNGDTALRWASVSATVGVFTVLFFAPWAVVLGGLPVVLAAMATAGLDGDGVNETVRPHVASAATAALLALGLLYFAGTLAVALVYMNRAARSDSAATAVAAYSRAAEVVPAYAYPRFMVLHAEGGQLGSGEDALRDWQRRVLAEPATEADASYALILVRDSLDQAYRWGRPDLEWERALLASAGEAFPASPDATLERLHLAVLQGDIRQARQLLAAAEAASVRDSRLALYRYYLLVLEGDEAQASALRDELADEYEARALLIPQRSIPAP